MALYKRDGEWIVKLNRGPYNGKSLAWCERQHTHSEGCVKCGMRTLHNDRGCIECQEEARK